MFSRVFRSGLASVATQQTQSLSISRARIISFDCHSKFSCNDDQMKSSRRQGYTMVARAEGMAVNRDRIVQAALKLLLEQAYEDITLVAIAEAADVSHQTVLNHFESKENVAAAAAEQLSRDTAAARARAKRGDLNGAISILVGEYERFGDAGARWAVASERLGSLAPLLDAARASHQAWLEHIFRAGFRGARCAAPCDSRAPRGNRRVHVETAASGPAVESRNGRTHHVGSRQGSPRSRVRPDPSSALVPGEDAVSPHNYLFALVDGGGNVPPELSAARRLVDRGHAVTVLAEDSIARDVRSAGAVLRRWERAPNRPDRKPANDPSRDWECKYPWQLVDRLTRDAHHGARGAVRRRRQPGHRGNIARPRGLLHVLRWRNACRRKSGRAVRCGVLHDFPLPAKGIPPFGIGLRPARSVIGRWRDRTLNLLAERLWDRGLTGLNALRSQYGLPPLVHFLDQLRCGDVNWCRRL